MTALQQLLFDTILDEMDADIHWTACVSDANLEVILRRISETVEKKYMARKKVHAGIRPATRARYEEEIEEVRAALDQAVRERFAQYRKARTIALLEYPLLSVKVEDVLPKRNIRYLFETKMDRNILTVHIIDEYFFEIPLTLENADRTIGLVGYFIHRPEYAHEELPEIRKVWSRQLYRQWNSLTATSAP